MRPIFEFIDYRQFLRAYYDEKKTQYGFSYRTFARRARIGSPSFLKHVIDGKRNLTRVVVEKFAGALQLSPKEQAYFRNLVLFNQARTATEKQEHYLTLRSLSGNVKETILKASQYDYFDTWYSPIIRELVCLHDFKDDFRLLGSFIRPRVGAVEAHKAVKRLLELDLIRKRADGTYVQTSAAIAADDAVVSMALRNFMKAMLDHARDALDTVDRTKRSISGLTIGISPAQFDVLAAEIEAFKDRVKTIVSRDRAGSVVYQLNIALFPVSEDAAPPEGADEGDNE